MVRVGIRTSESTDNFLYWNLVVIFWVQTQTIWRGFEMTDQRGNAISLSTLSAKRSKQRSQKPLKCSQKVSLTKSHSPFIEAVTQISEIFEFLTSMRIFGGTFAHRGNLQYMTTGALSPQLLFLYVATLANITRIFPLLFVNRTSNREQIWKRGCCLIFTGPVFYNTARKPKIFNWIFNIMYINACVYFKWHFPSTPIYSNWLFNFIGSDTKNDFFSRAVISWMCSPAKKVKEKANSHTLCGDKCCSCFMYIFYPPLLYYFINFYLIFYL